jgi:hypothetical protein
LLLASLFSRGRKINSLSFLSFPLSLPTHLFSPRRSGSYTQCPPDRHTQRGERESRREGRKKKGGELLEEVASASPMGWKRGGIE